MSKKTTSKTNEPAVGETSVAVGGGPVTTTATPAPSGSPAGEGRIRTALGMTKSSKGYAAYVLKFEGMNVIDIEPLTVDASEPYLSHQAAIDLVKRKFVEMYVLEGVPLEEML